MLPGAESYWLVRFLFQRALAIIYLSAFLVAWFQFRPLAGEDGLLPIENYVERASFKDRPSLFYLYPSDRVIGLTAGAGVVLSVAALLGLPYLLPEPYPVVISILLWGLLWALYLSFVNAGQLFYGYGWESMLLETGFLAIFLGAGDTGPPVLVIWLIKWVLFRNMFGAGLIKIRGDDCWRELTCLDYHYETQPMPNPLSWYAHHLPKPFHRVEVLGNHVVELAVSFLYFAPQPYAAVGGVLTIGFQLWLMLTGNFAFLNALTIVQGIATFSDGVLTAAIPIGAPEPASTPVALEIAAIALTLLVLGLSIRPVFNMLSPSQVMNTAFDPLNLVNTYGAFGSITKRRYQLVIQGTRESNPAEDDWETYETKGQPVRTDERPPQWARTTCGWTGSCGSRRCVRGQVPASAGCSPCSKPRSKTTRRSSRYSTRIRSPTSRPSRSGCSGTATSSRHPGSAPRLASGGLGNASERTSSQSPALTSGDGRCSADRNAGYSGPSLERYCPQSARRSATSRYVRSRRSAYVSDSLNTSKMGREGLPTSEIASASSIAAPQEYTASSVTRCAQSSYSSGSRSSNSPPRSLNPTSWRSACSAKNSAHQVQNPQSSS